MRIMRWVDINRSLAILLCLLGCNVWKAVTKTLQEDSDAKEVTLKVHVSDSGTHQPISGATIEIFANQTSFAAETSGPDGNAFVRFQYRVGTQLIVTATKPSYVPNSAPWQPARLPVFSSLSLDLLPERSATLMVYEDVVQIVSGFHGSRVRPWVQFQRRALSLPPDASYTNLTALLTVASSSWEVDRFPYLQDLGTNGTGSGRRLELTPVTAISVLLLSGDGRQLSVSEPVSVTVPLSPDCGLKENDHVPAWRFDPKLGAWLKSSLGYVQKVGDQLTLTYIAPQLGYWAAAMSPLYAGGVVAKDISTYHTVFLLAILGGMAVILLFLLGLLLCYCRRKCLRPRLHHRKLPLTPAPDGSRRDQATSMSHLNLISEVHLELAPRGAEPDLCTPMLKSHLGGRGSLDNLACRAALPKEYHKSVEAFPARAARSSGPSESELSPAVSNGSVSYRQPLCADSVCSKGSIREPPSTPEREQAMDRRPADYMLSRSVDNLERPGSFPRPGQLLCCSSVDQVAEGAYRRARPTLVIPAHYMKLPGEHPYAGQALLLQTDQQSDLDTIQAELSASHQPLGPPGSEPAQFASCDHTLCLQDPPDGKWTLQSATVPESLSEAGLVQMNGEDQLLAEKTLMELRGGKPLPHPRAWFVSLDGRSNAHIRHSYIDLQRAGRNGSNDASLDSGVDMNEPRLGRRPREGLRERGMERERERKSKATPPLAYTQLVYVDDMEPDGSENGTPEYSPEDNALGPLLQEAQRPKNNTEVNTLSPLPQEAERPKYSTDVNALGPLLQEAQRPKYSPEDIALGPLLQEAQRPKYSPEDIALGPLLQETKRPKNSTEVNALGPLPQEAERPKYSTEVNALGPLLQEAQRPKYGTEVNAHGPLLKETLRPEEDGEADLLFRAELASPELKLPCSPPGDEEDEDDVQGHDDSGEDENKKSPWQKREERPLLAFNLK